MGMLGVLMPPVAILAIVVAVVVAVVVWACGAGR